MQCTDILKHEHQVIILVLGGVEREGARIAATGELRGARVGEMVDFFRNFTDRCHHAKEEKLLFPRLVERGLPAEGGPIGVMLHEHDLGRGHVRAIAEVLEQPAAEPGAAQTVLEHLLGYAELLRAHIDKENNVLFAMAAQLLSADDDASLVEAFDRVEAEELGEGVHERYHQLAHELASG